MSLNIHPTRERDTSLPFPGGPSPRLALLGVMGGGGEGSQEANPLSLWHMSRDSAIYTHIHTPLALQRLGRRQLVWKLVVAGIVHIGHNVVTTDTIGRCGGNIAEHVEK